MRYAIHKPNETSIFQMLEVSEYLVDQVIPVGYVAVPVGVEVSDATHNIVDGKAVLKTEVDAPAS
jgi:hypothetical protein